MYEKPPKCTGGILDWDADRHRSPYCHVALTLPQLEAENFLSGVCACSWGLGRSLPMQTSSVLSFHSSPTDGVRGSPFPAQSLQATAVVFPFNYLYVKDYCILQHLFLLRQLAAVAPLVHNFSIKAQLRAKISVYSFSTLRRSYVQWKLYKCRVPARMSFPQNVTTILLCNSELIKSNQNSLYHFLREVTSFILFPFNLNLISISTFTFLCISSTAYSRHPSYFTLWSKQCRITGVENLDWKYHENRLCQELSSISCFWLSWKYSEGEILAQLKSMGILPSTSMGLEFHSWYPCIQSQLDLVWCEKEKFSSFFFFISFLL